MIKLEETKHVCDLPEWFDPKTCKIGFIYKKGIVEVDICITRPDEPVYIYDRKSGRWEKEK